MNARSAIISSARTRTLRMGMVAAALLTGNWGCEVAKGVGPASNDQRVASIDVQYSAFEMDLGGGNTDVRFDVVNPALSSLLGDSRGRLIGVHVLWTSSNPAIVAVATPDVASSVIGGESSDRTYGAKITISPLALGTAVITGTVTGAPTINDAVVTTKITVTVTAPPAKLVISPKPLTILTTATAGTRITAQMYDANGTALLSNTAWSCADTSVAMIATLSNEYRCGRSTTQFGSPQFPVITDNSVIVFPKKPGTATFIATYQHIDAAGVSKIIADTINVIVTSGVAKVVVTPATTSMIIGGVRQLAAKALDASGNVLTGLPVTWGTRNAAVIAVDANGTAKGIASGNAPGQTLSANAFATIDGVSGDATLTVYRSPNVVVSPNTNSLTLNQSVTLHAKLVDSDNTTQIPFTATGVNWTSDNATLASVTFVDDSTATVKALAIGATQARATAGNGASGVADIKIAAAAAAATLEVWVTTGPTTMRPAVRTNEPLAVSGTLALKAIVRDASGNILVDPAVFTSSAPTIASVDASSGLVTAKAVGAATIGVKSSLNPNLVLFVEINVSAASGGTPASMSIAPSTATVHVGDTQQYSVTLRDASGNVVALPSNGSVSYATDDSNVADPANTTGLIKAFGAGSTAVRATLKINGVQNGTFAAATLTVVP